MNNTKLDINKLFNFALIAVGFSNQDEYLRTLKSRKIEYVFKRQVLAWLLMKKIERLSTLEAERLMGKDHATIIHSVRKVEELYEINYTPIVNLVNNSSKKFKELVYNYLSLEQETSLNVMLELILEAINNGMEIDDSIKDTINPLYKNTLNFLNNDERISNKVIWKRMVRGVRL